MAGQVQPIGMRPLMFKRSVNYVRIAVHKEPALNGNIYTVLFLGTGELSDKGSHVREQMFTFCERSRFKARC